MGTQLDIMKWGPGISDIRNLHKVQFEPGEASQASAEKILADTIEAAPPGVIFTSNPHYGIYAKWDNLFAKVGFKLAAPFCAINRVYSREWTWKGKEKHPAPTGGRKPWESPDGFLHWIHAQYLVKEPVPRLSFDWDHFDGANGDTDGHKMWCVGYGTRATAPTDGGYRNVFEPEYARLAHNCGCAMGHNPPKNGKLVDEEFYTIMAIDEAKTLPTGYTRFLRVGGLKFGHNLKKLLGDTATECFHKFDVL
jgi:hypothetical protein